MFLNQGGKFLISKIHQTRAMRPSSKRGMPESSITRQVEPENQLRSKLLSKTVIDTKANETA